MTVISDQAPPGPDYILRKIATLEREVRELKAARRLEAATIKAGSLRVVDAAGELKVQVGLLPDGSYGLAAVNPDGQTVTLATLAFGPVTASTPALQACTSSSYGDLATVGPTVTAAIGPSGRAIVILSAAIAVDEAAGTGYMGVEVSTSGAEVLPGNPDDGRALHVGTSGTLAGKIADAQTSLAVLLSGLPTDTLTFTAKYRRLGSGGTLQFTSRSMIVIPY